MATTRVYLNTEAIPYNPATLRGAWDATASPSTGKLSPVPVGAATNITKAETVATNNWDILFGKWSTVGLVDDKTIDGTVTWIIRRSEANADANAVFHVHLFVTVGNSDVVRGTLLTDSIGATEFPTTIAAGGEGAKTLSSVDAKAGDHIVLELGSQLQNTHTTSRNIIIGYAGANDVDATNGGTTAGQPKWLEFSVELPLLAKMLSISDNFNDNSIDVAKWTNWGGANVAEASGEIEITTSTVAGNYFGLDGAVYTSLISSRASARLVDAGNQALASYLTFFLLSKNPSNTIAFVITGGNITAEYQVATAFTDPATQTYNATTHKWLRFREQSGTLYWEYASQTQYDANNWQTLHSMASPFPLNALFPEFAVGTDSAELSTTIAKWDDYNVIATVQNTKTFTADGIVLATTTNTFTADGIVATGVSTNTQTFTSDGIVLAQTQKTFTADGIVLATTTATFTTDGIVQAMTTKTFTADGLVLATTTNTFTTDGIVKATQTLTYTADGVVQAQQISAFTADGVVRETQTNTFTTDGIILATTTKTFTADGVVLEQKTQTFTIDGLIQTQNTQTFTADGIVKEAILSAFTVDGVVKATTITTFTTDGVVQESITKTFTADGLVKEINTATFTADGVVQALTTQTFTADGVIIQGSQAIFSVDGIVKATITNTFTADGLIKEVNTKTFTVDGVVKEQFSLSFTIDGIVKAQQQTTFTTDAIVKEVVSKTFTVDALVKQVQQATFTVDAQIKEILVTTVALDGIVKATQTLTFTVDALIKQISTLELTVDALIVLVNNASVTADGIVLAQQIQGFTIDGIVRDTVLHNQVELTLDAIIVSNIVGLAGADEEGYGAGKGLYEETPVLIDEWSKWLD